LNRIDFMLMFCTNVFALPWTFDYGTRTQPARSDPFRVRSRKNRLNYASKCSGSKTFLVRTRPLVSCFLRLLAPIPFFFFLSHHLSSPFLLPPSLSRVLYVKWKSARATCQILSKYFTAAFNPIWHNGGTRNRIKGALWCQDPPDQSRRSKGEISRKRLPML